VHGTKLRAATWFYGLTAALGWLLGRWLSPSGPWRHPDPWWSLPASARWPLALVVGVAAGASLAWLSQRLVTHWPPATHLHRVLRDAVLPLPPRGAMVLAVGSGLGEELLFRGALQPALGLVPAALLFGALHVAPGRRLWVWPLWAALAGLLFGALHAATGLLLAPVAAHATANYLNLRFLEAYVPDAPAGSPSPAKGSSG